MFNLILFAANYNRSSNEPAYFTGFLILFFIICFFVLIAYLVADELKNSGNKIYHSKNEPNYLPDKNSYYFDEKQWNLSLLKDYEKLCNTMREKRRKLKKEGNPNWTKHYPPKVCLNNLEEQLAEIEQKYHD